MNKKNFQHALYRLRTWFTEATLNLLLQWDCSVAWRLRPTLIYRLTINLMTGI